MISIHYSGSLTPNSEISDLTLSLGGFKSSTTFQNSKLENLFNSIYSREISEEYRLLILTNESNTPKVVSVIVSTESSLFEYSLSACSPAIVCNYPKFENIQVDSKPIYVSSFTSSLNNIDVAPLSCLGVWVCRKSIPSLEVFNSCEESEETISLRNKPSEESFRLTINYD